MSGVEVAVAGCALRLIRGRQRIDLQERERLLVEHVDLRLRKAHCRECRGHRRFRRLRLGQSLLRRLLALAKLLEVGGQLCLELGFDHRCLLRIALVLRRTIFCLLGRKRRHALLMSLLGLAP